jgi:4a-hydroxytetrahydrobiopterin dehydratase
MFEVHMITPLSNEQLTNALIELDHWVYDKDRKALYRAVRLTDFSEAIGLMVRIALEAEKADHHPEWTNVYNRVQIWLTTHDAGDVSERDISLARVIDALLK